MLHYGVDAQGQRQLRQYWARGDEVKTRPEGSQEGTGCTGVVDHYKQAKLAAPNRTSKAKITRDGNFNSVGSGGHEKLQLPFFLQALPIGFSWVTEQLLLGQTGLSYRRRKASCFLAAVTDRA